jgi:hypothetical protein
MSLRRARNGWCAALILANFWQMNTPVSAEQPFLGQWALAGKSCSDSDALVSIGAGNIQIFGQHCRFSDIRQRDGITVFSGQCRDPDDNWTYVGSDILLRMKADGLYLSFVEGEEGTGPYRRCPE